MEGLRRALLPMFLCCSAKSDDTKALDYLLSQGANVNNTSDYDGKTCLHIACAEGNVGMVKHLIRIGASIYVKDRRGRVPLFDAIRYSTTDTFVCFGTSIVLAAPMLLMVVNNTKDLYQSERFYHFYIHQ